MTISKRACEKKEKRDSWINVWMTGRKAAFLSGFASFFLFTVKHNSLKHSQHLFCSAFPHRVSPCRIHPNHTAKDTEKQREKRERKMEKYQQRNGPKLQKQRCATLTRKDLLPVSKDRRKKRSNTWLCSDKQFIVAPPRLNEAAFSGH